MILKLYQFWCAKITASRYFNNPLKILWRFTNLKCIRHYGFCMQITRRRFVRMLMDRAKQHLKCDVISIETIYSENPEEG